MSDADEIITQEEPESGKVMVPARPTLKMGSLIAGQYRVLRPLGSGGMGEVVRAHDEALDRDVAIKLIRFDMAIEPKARDDFLAEARAMARLAHPNVVGVHAVGQLRGAPYLVMEYVPGTSLSSLLMDRDGPLGIDEAAFILDQVGRGLAAMHAAGLVHRDLKPANVLLGPGFRVVIGDLGIARVLGDTRPEDDVWVAGTPSYMAPEIRLAASAGPGLAARADIFSLGVMAYQLLTGRLPYRDARISGLEKPEPPSLLRPELSAEVDEVIEQALEMFPDRRPHSADAFRRHLVGALHAGASRRPGPRRVLVVDDDDAYRDLTRLVLARAFRHATIEGVPDGATALAAARHARPDLVVTDYDMPGIDGGELVTRLRALPGGRALPIVLCTAVAGPTDWRLLSTLGADGFLAKPFEPTQLVALARGVIDARRAGGHRLD